MQHEIDLMVVREKEQNQGLNQSSFRDIVV